MKALLLLAILAGCADPKSFERNVVNNVYVAPEQPGDSKSEEKKEKPECNEGQSNVSKKDCDGKEKKSKGKENNEDR